MTSFNIFFDILLSYINGRENIGFGSNIQVFTIFTCFTQYKTVTITFNSINYIRKHLKLILI